MLRGKGKARPGKSHDGECACGIRKAISDEITSDRRLEGTNHEQYMGQDDSVPYEQQVQTIRQADVIVVFEEQRKAQHRCSGVREGGRNRK